jgi:hypothetical protein
MTAAAAANIMAYRPMVAPDADGIIEELSIKNNQDNAKDCIACTLPRVA